MATKVKVQRQISINGKITIQQTPDCDEDNATLDVFLENANGPELFTTLDVNDVDTLRDFLESWIDGCP